MGGAGILFSGYDISSGNGHIIISPRLQGTKICTVCNFAAMPDWRNSLSWDSLFPAYSDASRVGLPRSFDPLIVRCDDDVD